jgi:hypothetical protein
MLMVDFNFESANELVACRNSPQRGDDVYISPQRRAIGAACPEERNNRRRAARNESTSRSLRSEEYQGWIRYYKTSRSVWR